MLECLDEPRTEVDELEVREGCVADHLGEVKVAMAEVGLVCVHEGVRDLNDVQEYQLQVIVGHLVLQRAKILLLDNAVEILVALAVLGQLHNEHFVDEDLVSADDVLAFWRQVNPIV